MFTLIDNLEKIVGVFTDAGIVYEVIDGVAVNAHIFALHRSRSFVTRDIELLILLIFSGERYRSTQPSPHPDVQPEMKSLFGLMTLPVAPLSEYL